MATIFPTDSVREAAEFMTHIANAESTYDSWVTFELESDSSVTFEPTGWDSPAQAVEAGIRFVEQAWFERVSRHTIVKVTHSRKHAILAADSSEARNIMLGTGA